MPLDVHQHRLGERLSSELSQRVSAPRLTRGPAGWELHVATEDPVPLPGREGSGDAPALVALSPALGLERLARRESDRLVDAWHRDADELPPSLRAWGALAPGVPGAEAVDAALDGATVGVCISAQALASPTRLDTAGALLRRLAERDRPLFVHPGPAPAGAWVAPLTSYVAELQAAWLTWMLHGRRRHPALRVVFAALAGLAPLQRDRVRARLHTDPLAGETDRVFYETSSYGPEAVRCVAASVGESQVVYGTDLPWAVPDDDPLPMQGAAMDANADALLGHVGAVA